MVYIIAVIIIDLFLKKLFVAGMWKFDQYLTFFIKDITFVGSMVELSFIS